MADPIIIRDTFGVDGKMPSVEGGKPDKEPSDEEMAQLAQIADEVRARLPHHHQAK